jgi:O-antigen/teichoic acid export membrane protein
VPIVFGTEFSENHLVIFASGVSGWLLGLSFLLSTPILLGDRTGLLAVVAAGAVVVNLVLNTILIPPYGVSGAAIATVSSYFLFCLMTLLAAGPRNAAWVASWPHIALIAGLLGCVFLAIVFPWLALVAVLSTAVASGAWADIRRGGRSRDGDRQQ